jgi:pimeloyl-ACP methyl ester carboxylesterase
VGLGGRAVGRVDIMGHSGGYVGMASALARGGADIRGVVLLDALYGDVGTFSGWLTRHAGSVGVGPDGYRLASITTGGGTLTNTQTVDRATRSLLGGKVADSLDLAKPVIFTRTSMSHTDTSRRLPEMFWRYW